MIDAAFGVETHLKYLKYQARKFPLSCSRKDGLRESSRPSTGSKGTRRVANAAVAAWDCEVWSPVALETLVVFDARGRTGRLPLQ